MTQRTVVIVKVLIWAGCLAPLALLVAQAFGYAGGLGANDIDVTGNVFEQIAAGAVIANSGQSRRSRARNGTQRWHSESQAE